MHIVVGELDLLPIDRPGVIDVVGNDASLDITIENAGVQDEQIDESRKSQLTGFQDGIQIPHFLENPFLGCIHPEPDALSALVPDQVQIVQSVILVSQQVFQLPGVVWFDDC